MALFDNWQFNPQSFGGDAGGLLSRLLPQLQFGQQTATPGELGSDRPTSYQQIGQQQFPVFGTPDPAALPPNARPMQGQLPQQVQPQQQEPGFGDRLLAGLSGFQTGGQEGGLIGAVTGGITGLTSGASRQNQTVQALVSRGVDPAIAQQIVRDPAMMRAAVPSLLGGNSKTDDIKEFEYERQFDPTLTFKKFMDRKRSVTGERGLNIIYGKDEKGNTVAMQPSKAGGLELAQLPAGVTLAPGIESTKLGTKVIHRNGRTGEIVAIDDIDVAGAASQQVQGKDEGEAINAYKSVTSKMPGLTAVIKKLDELSAKATYTLTGQGLDYGMRQLGMEPRDAAIARSEYISMVDNQVLPLLRDTFGAAFTQKEGDTLRATLGDADKSPQEKQAILRSFIEQKYRDIEGLAIRTGKVTPQAYSPPPTAATSSSIDDLVKKYSR